MAAASLAGHIDVLTMAVQTCARPPLIAATIAPPPAPRPVSIRDRRRRRAWLDQPARAADLGGFHTGARPIHALRLNAPRPARGLPLGERYRSGLDSRDQVAIRAAS